MRAIWKGWLSFGLINIPVNLYSAVKEKELKFHFLHAKDLSPIRFGRICKKDSKEIPWEDVVKGYELKSGDYIVLADEDFEKANLRRVKTIEILDFTQESEIDSLYFERPFFLEPQKGAAKAYFLLREALKRSKKIAIATFVLKNREHLAVIKPHQEMLILNQLRFAEELRESSSLRIPKKEKVAAKELEMAIKLINQLTHPFNPKHYKDTYRQEMMKIIHQKTKRGKRKAKTLPLKIKSKGDLMKMLTASLKKQKRKLAA